MSDMVPEGWTSRQIGSDIDILSGFPFKSEYFTNDPALIGLIRIRDLIKQRMGTFYEGGYEQEYLITKGDVLIGMDGDFHIVKWASDNALLNQRICKIQTENSIFFDLDYLFHDLQDELLRIHEKTGSTTVKHLSVKDIKGIQKPFPPLPEQKKIASILTSVDDVIENTQRQINKLQDLKKATMNELLTKGIGHTEFKDSELGRIPKSWEVSNIGKSTEFVTSGSRGWSQYYSQTGSLFIRIGNLTRDHINLKFEDIQLVDPPKGGEGTRTKVKLGDILVSITADLGVIGVVNEEVGEAYVNQHVCLVRLIQQREVMPRWIGHFLSGHEGQEQFSKKNDGGAKAGLNLPTIRSVLVPIPSPHEQDQIVRTLDRLDSDISGKKRKLEKQQSLKKSLMQDLLTGKVRVQVN